MSRNIIWEEADDWGGRRGNAPIPPATERQLSYLADLVRDKGFEPDGYEPETMNIREASDMIEVMLDA